MVLLVQFSYKWAKEQLKQHFDTIHTSVTTSSVYKSVGEKTRVFSKLFPSKLFLLKIFHFFSLVLAEKPTKCITLIWSSPPPIFHCLSPRLALKLVLSWRGCSLVFSWRATVCAAKFWNNQHLMFTILTISEEEVKVMKFEN